LRTIEQGRPEEGQARFKYAAFAPNDNSALSGCFRDTAELTSDFAGVVHNLIKDVRDCYRPELHYMRGPGPKWRAKHQPWIRFDSAAVPTRQHELSPVLRPRDSANPNR
jgi:hypothetical protein